MSPTRLGFLPTVVLLAGAAPGGAARRSVSELALPAHPTPPADR